MDPQYVYAATSSGLSIVDIETEEQISFASYADGFSSVWADDDYVYLGTTASGVMSLSKVYVGLVDLSSYVEPFLSYPDITCNQINYIHGNSNKLILCTVSGVDIMRKDSLYITHTYISTPQKCFVTENYDYFYYTISGSTWSLNRLNNNRSNWTYADKTYFAGENFLAGVEKITDFFITEHTSTSGTNNTIFITTDIDVRVYDEGSEEYIILNTI
jgi:hypothetical protein